jgi:hypothetical protein
MDQKDCARALSSMTADAQIRFLAVLGHNLTVVGRSAYEFQKPGVIDPLQLRALNEIHHRIYSQIRALGEEGAYVIDAEGMAAWVAGEGQPVQFQQACLWAFEQSLRSIAGNAAKEGS